jgi:pSer/pThr/pTyr-binding forkhead associated (FHA) protein
MMRAPLAKAMAPVPPPLPEPPSALAPPAAPEEVSPTWRLRGVAGPASGRTFDLLGETRMGRDAARCTVLVDEQTVSREHAALVPDPVHAAWRLQRLSRSGYVYVNGHAVEDAILSAGDQIQVGTSVLVLEVA